MVAAINRPSCERRDKHCTQYWITYERTERRLRRPSLSDLRYGLVSIGVGNAALGVFTLCAHFLG